MSKAKKVNFEFIDDITTEPYKILATAHKWHQDILGASIALAWRVEQKPDKDGHVVLGKCLKVSDLYKEFAAYDFIIVLNREVWDDPEFTKEKKLALLDHELCHAAPQVDNEGEVYDERGRQVFRCRKHDIEEFYAVVRRHGCYKRDLELFAEEIKKKRAAPLFDAKETAAREARPVN